jgi:hypothetical protein
MAFSLITHQNQYVSMDTSNIYGFFLKKGYGFINYERTAHTFEALAVEVDELKLLLLGAKVDCGSFYDDGRTGVPGGVRSLAT